ncbi:Ribonuclease HI [Bienertia sinuspersici]
MKQSIRRIKVYTDSQLVAGQMRGEFETNDLEMVKYKQKVKELIGGQEKFNIVLILRKYNSKEDTLAKLAIFTAKELKRTIMMKVLEERSADGPQHPTCLMINEDPSKWYYDIVQYKERRNEQALRGSLNLLPEVRLMVVLRTASYKDRISRAYNKKVKGRKTEEGDLVLRRTASMGKKGLWEANTNWEGPYRVIQLVILETYRLANMEGREMKSTWNASFLKKFYS